MTEYLFHENLLTESYRITVERKESPTDIYDHVITFYSFYGRRPIVIMTILDPMDGFRKMENIELIVGDVVNHPLRNHQRLIAFPLTDSEKDDILYTSWERGIPDPEKLLENFEILVPCKGDEIGNDL